MKTNEQNQPASQKTKKQKKGRSKFFWFAAGTFLGGVGVYLYTNKEARQKVMTTGKRVYTSTSDFVTGIFKKNSTPCNDQPEGIIVIRETVVPEVKTPRFEQQARPRHRRHESTWTKPAGQEVNKSLNVNK